MEQAFQHDEQRSALIDAVEASLRPLMPLFLNYGVTHHDLTEMLARVFVTAIEEQLKKEGRPTTVGRLALSTGINRSRVEKIISDRDAAAARRAFATHNTSALALVLATWHDDPRFSTPYGVPLDLEFAPAAGRRSFVDLVNVAYPGYDPDAALDQLIAAGCVEVHEQGFMRCTDRVYMPAGVDKARIARLGECVGALAATFAQNLLRGEDDPTYFERQVETDYMVSLESRRAIQDHMHSEGQAFLASLDQWLSARHDQFMSTNGKRFGISMFAYDVAEESSVEPVRLKSAG
ncbi:MAG: hypothetical protein IT480_04255 [Gammaproteobacteria bacterium]|nr:hypothetical protein [Gammaproteobacteria bacterium]